MTKTLFSICSISHLSYFKTMLDSFLLHNLGYNIVLGLVDKVETDFNFSINAEVTIVQIDQLDIPDFNEIVNGYNPLELSCAMKPYVADFIFKKYNPDILLYLDTDILIFDNFDYVENLLNNNDIILTPHTFTEINDDNIPSERGFLKAGVFNAGFFMLKNTSNVLSFLNWWMLRMKNQCHIDFNEGMMLDQNWFNLVPYFFNKVGICDHLGYNFAYWNFHERLLSKTGGNYTVNNNFNLVFIHISGFDINHPAILSKHQNRFNLTDLNFVNDIYSAYVEKLIANNYFEYKEHNCFYSKKVTKSTGVLKILNTILDNINFKLVKS